MYNILFVDDEPSSTYALRLLMESNGFCCKFETNMSDAVKHISQHHVDVLVSDIMMPSGDDFPDIDSSETGFILVRKVRHEFPSIGVICLSVVGDQTKIEGLKKLGVLYLRKGETPLQTAAKLIESKATGKSKY